MPENPQLKDLRVYLDADIHMRLKILCVKKNRSMSSVVAELVEQWIEETEELERQKRPPRS
ncbi:plasmid partition protein ParG [Mastigocoleus testarum]|uniref:CopG family transcriptional regulator n=1 Tax=Mastigocoleus testarum BC008 TaxID=371196 RepID=A0A0V7ZXK8_9CYAN|nr:plasmid partition protein ParG [Mastigocoleus testarum]KST69319.1 hypothetical protein BC008_03785 [Mastigocoleus testarum BC008]KST69333.1 hypothetical protein BC008_03855 [Mastigocoleus testarum BC008]